MSFDLSRASLLPEYIRFGTSSWNYPGWAGQIYHREYRDEKALRDGALEEYVQFPWFRTVGIDSSFYGPPAQKTLERYARQVPAEFQWVAKVWEELTIPTFPRLPRYGQRAGHKNPHFLNPAIFSERFLPRFLLPGIREHLGAFVFQFAAIDLRTESEQSEFIDRIGSFLSELPTGIRYAVEIRNPELLNEHYVRTLNRVGATHCFNHWTAMPRLRDQMLAIATGGGLTSEFYVSRILTPLGMSYEKAVKTFSPYRQIRQPQPEMREDVLRLCKRGLERKVPVYILVNNRCEGNSPETIDAIGNMLVRTIEQADT